MNRIRSTMPPLLALLLGAALLSGCGAGKGEAPANPGGVATIGPEGGVLTAPGGAQVTVPPGAAQAAVTLRLARDATGMPTLPPGASAVGDVFSLTPHGAQFAEPVQVRLPAALRPLQPDERLMVAKLSPGGTWALIAPEVTEQALTLPVQSFSWFVPVALRYAQPVQTPTFQPLELQIRSVTCDGGSCSSVIPDGAEVVLDLISNQGVAWSGCAGPSLVVGAVPGGTLFDAGISIVAVDPLDQPLGGAASYRFRFRVNANRRTELLGRLPSSGALEVRLRCANPEVASPLLSTGVYFPLKGPSVTLPPRFGVAVSATCNGGPCTDLIGPQRLEVAALVSGRGDLPSGCASRPFLTLARVGGPYLADSGYLRTSSAPPPSDPTRYSVTNPQQPLLVNPPVPLSDLLMRLVLRCMNGYGSTFSSDVATFWLTFAAAQAIPPTFTTQPRSLLVSVGQTASFTAVAGGQPPPTLQWQRRAAGAATWDDLPGATSGTYTTPPLAAADSVLEYRLLATNQAGSVASQAVGAVVTDGAVAPVVLVQPTALAVVTGSEALFAVVARGTEALSYQWLRDGVPLTAANGATLKLPAVTSAEAGSYAVVVRNDVGAVTSQAATLAVSPGLPASLPPTLVTQPAALLVYTGNTATFAVGVGGRGPFTFQWRKDGTPLGGATSAALTLVDVQAADVGAYSVVVANAVGPVTSADASLQVSTVPPPPVTPLSISTQPASLIVLPGGAATLAVAASGTGPLAYQWSRDGAPVDGATGPVLTLASVSPADAGSYTVTVSNAAGSVTSAAAQLVLIGAPFITTQPAATSAAQGSTATFAVGASGDALRYQWERDRLPIAGATASTYTTPVLGAGDSGAAFQVLVYNAAGLVQSLPAVLTVTLEPTVTLPPSAGKLAAGPNHTCAIKADGTVACWGRNSKREVTPANGFDQDLPVVVPGVSGATQVAVGFQRSCAIDGAGGLSCWGGGALAVEPLRDAGGLAFTGARGVALGTAHGCLIDAGGSVKCWGDNSVGQLGQGTTSAFVAVPVAVSRSGGAVLTSTVSLSAGAFHTCALTSAGEVVCWGRGAIGDGSPAQPTGDQLALLAGAPAVAGASAMASGESHACAALAAGGMRCWGANGSAQLGNRNTTTPQLAPVSVVDLPGLLVGVTHIAARADSTCVIPASGRVVCWGAVAPSSLSGILTYGPIETGSLTLAVVGLASGVGHSCALVADGSLECWGGNPYGQLGVGGTIGLLTGGPSPPGTSVSGGATFWKGP